MKKVAFTVSLLAVLFCLSSVSSVFAEKAVPVKKQTTLGKYVTAKEANMMYQKSPKTVKILDVRTLGEYTYVGHATMAASIPWSFLRAGITAKGNPRTRLNKNFLSDVNKRYKKNDIILVMSRNGYKSARAINDLAKAGYTNLYNVLDGFQGDMDKKKRNTINGWINSGGKWTFKLNPKLVYKSAKK